MRLEPLYRIRFSYPESWAIGLDGGWQQMFFIAEGRCEGEVTGRFCGANFPLKQGAAGPFRAGLPGGNRGRRRGGDHGGVARVWPCLPAGKPLGRRVRVPLGRPGPLSAAERCGLRVRRRGPGAWRSGPGRTGSGYRRGRADLGAHHRLTRR